jgi:hypothetical protein
VISCHAETNFPLFRGITGNFSKGHTDQTRRPLWLNRSK